MPFKSRISFLWLALFFTGPTFAAPTAQWTMVVPSQVLENYALTQLKSKRGVVGYVVSHAVGKNVDRQQVIPKSLAKKLIGQIEKQKTARAPASPCLIRTRLYETRAKITKTYSWCGGKLGAEFKKILF